MARTENGGRTTDDGSTDPCAAIHHPITGPGPWPASRRNQKTFASHVRDRVAVKPPVTDVALPPIRTWWTEPNKAQHHPARPKPSPCDAGPMIGHIHSSRCRITSSRSREPQRRPGQSRAANSYGGRKASTRRSATARRTIPASVLCRPSPLASGEPVEPDGIEPTTSCLQSTRSPN